MNPQIIDKLGAELEIDCPREHARIIEFIRKTVKDLHKDGVVIGLSGGLDSSLCAYLREAAMGKKKVLAVLLPVRDSSPANHEHAHLVANTLGLRTIDQERTKTLQEMGVYELGIKKLENEKEVARFTKEQEAMSKVLFGGYAVTDTGFTPSNRKQNGNPLCRGNGFNGCGNLFRKLGNGWVFHIHDPEYMIATYSIFRM